MTGVKKWGLTHELDIVHLGNSGLKPESLRDPVQILRYLLAIPRLGAVEHQDRPARKLILGRGRGSLRGLGAGHGRYAREIDAGGWKAEESRLSPGIALGGFGIVNYSLKASMPPLGLMAGAIKKIR